MMDLFSYKENALKNLLAQEAAIGAESLGRITLRILQWAGIISKVEAIDVDMYKRIPYLAREFTDLPQKLWGHT